jgi:hypothetical protein
MEKEQEEITTVWELYLGGRSPSRQCVRLHFYKLKMWLANSKYYDSK